MKLRVLPRALRDLDHIRKTIEADDATAAEKVVARLVQSIELVAQKPDIGRPIEGRSVREWKVPGLPFVIPYKVDEWVTVLRVYHTKRKRPRRWT
jgi:addiction module RelE/StbE family toxin